MHGPDRALSMGVDVGGTWVRVVVTRGGRALARARSRTNRVPALPAFLRRVLRDCHATRVDALVVASRGIWTPREVAELRARLRPLARRVHVMSDAQAALLGALDGESGVLVLAGTGSIVLGRARSGRWARAGGLGPLLGDEGSAFWMGREWLRAMARDGDFARARAAARATAPVARIAALAPRVLGAARGGDPRARAVVRAAQTHLAGFVRDVARRLRLRPPVVVSWAGGVLDDPTFRAGLARAVRRAGLRARWRPPAAPAVVAAIRLAERLAAR
ncbi:MAG TPA: BadF/BadG/BcrA/BcrD ATPase family protein [Methylomirabilota bacterium]